MATSSATFPSLLPRVADNLWFTLEKKSDDDAVLAKEEEEYAASVSCRRFLLSLHQNKTNCFEFFFLHQRNYKLT